MTRRHLVLFLASAMLAFGAVPAMAQTPTQGGYGPIPIPIPPASHHSPTPNAGREPQTVRGAPNRLPFTGVDVRVLLLGGLTLLGAGYGLRRQSRPHRE